MHTGPFTRNIEQDQIDAQESLVRSDLASHLCLSRMLLEYIEEHRRMAQELEELREARSELLRRVDSLEDEKYDLEREIDDLRDELGFT